MRYTTTCPSPWLYLHPSYALLVFLVKWHRIAKGYTVAQLAAMLGTDTAYVAQRENMDGAATFTEPMLQQLSVILDAPELAAFRYPRARQPRIQMRIYSTQADGRVLHHIEVKDINAVVAGEWILLEKINKDCNN